VVSTSFRPYQNTPAHNNSNSRSPNAVTIQNNVSTPDGENGPHVGSPQGSMSLDVDDVSGDLAKTKTGFGEPSSVMAWLLSSSSGVVGGM
jgi:hypothetical protein